MKTHQSIKLELGLFLFLLFFQINEAVALYTSDYVSQSYQINHNTDALLSDSTKNSQGVIYHYYEGDWNLLPDFTAITPLKSGTIANFSLAPREHEDLFGFAFDAYLEIETEGEYTFYTNSNDGSKLYIDEALVVNNDGLHGSRERSGKLTLSQGYHKIRVEFFQGQYGKDLQVYFEGPGVEKQLIPENKLYLEIPSAQKVTMINGINYSYYEGDWNLLPDFTAITPLKSGTIANFSLAPREHEDFFGFAFDAYLEIETEGEYTFYTNSNDGSKLYIDEALIVDNDGLHGSRERSGKLTLSQGYHKIRVEFFQGQYGKDLQVYFEGPGVEKQLIPENKLYLEIPSAQKVTMINGINYSYYEGDWNLLPDFTAITPLKSGTIANFSLAPREHEDFFGFAFDAYLEIETEGEYTFYTNSNDGSKLYIDEALIVDNDGLHGSRERSGKLTLSQGYHKIRVEFFQGRYGKDLQVYYEGPGVVKQPIPENKLFIEGEPEPFDSAPDLQLSKKGINYHYYEGVWKKLPDFETLAAVKSGTIYSITLENREREDFFAFVFYAWIEIDVAGEYTFYTKSDDGSKLYLNGQELVNNDGLHGPREKGGKVYLEIGHHPMLVSYFEYSRGSTLEVRYQGPGLSKQLIPAEKLFLTKPKEEIPTDTIPPQVTLTTNVPEIVSDSTFTLNISLTEPVGPASNFGMDDIAYTNANLSNFTGSEINFSVDVHPIADGVVSIWVPSGTFQDTVGNFNLASDTMNVNYEAPVVYKPLITNMASDVDSAEPGQALTFSWDEQDIQVQGYTFELSLYADSIFVDTIATDISQKTYTWNVPESFPTGIYTMQVGSRNVPGVISNSSPFSILPTDTIPPQVTLTTNVPEIVSDSTFTLNITLTEPVGPASNFGMDDIAYTNANLSNFTGSEINFSVDVHPIADGVVSIWVPSGTFQDTVGNFNLASDTMNVNYEAPVVYKPLITNMASDVDSAEPGQALVFSWDEQDIQVQGYTFELSLYADSIFVDTIATDISQKTYTWNVPESFPTGIYTMQVGSRNVPGVTSTSSPFKIDEPFSSPTAPTTQAAEFLSAKVSGDRSNELEVTFSGKLFNVTTDDFFTNKTHALIKARKMTGALTAADSIREVSNSDGTFTYIMQLSEHVVPGETPEFVYYHERGDIINTYSEKIGSVLFAPVDVTEVTAYNGSKALKTITKDQSWSDVLNAMGDNTIISIERGFESIGEETEIHYENLTLTAFGSGERPKIVFSGLGTYSFFSVDKNNLTFVGLHIVSNGLHGFAFRDHSSNCSIIDCYIEQQIGRKGSVAVQLYSRTQSAIGYPRNEGQKVLFSEAHNFGGGIWYNMSAVARYEWKKRYVEDLNQDGYRQPAMIVGNYLSLLYRNTARGDAISVGRTEHNWAEISYNNIQAWADDGFDAYQGSNYIVEHNTFTQNSPYANAGGGSALKLGGKGLDDSQFSQNFTTGYSGGIICRYNLVTKVDQGGQSHGINTNHGGNGNGKSIITETDVVTIGKSYIYGNLIYGVDKNALQLNNSNGNDWEVYNNLLVSDTAKGINVYNCTNLESIILKNNIFSSATAEISGTNNVLLSGYLSEGYVLDDTDILADLSDIFSNPNDLSNSDIIASSPTHGAGNLLGIRYEIDIRGKIVGGLVDIGPVESEWSTQGNMRTQAEATTTEITEGEPSESAAMVETEIKFEVYPVPFGEQFSVRVVQTDNPLLLQLWDLNGNIVYQEELEQNITEFIIDLSGHNIAEGKYVLTISQAGQIFESVNVLKY